MTSFNTNSLELVALMSANSKISHNFLFNASARSITINEGDCKSLLFVLNRTDGKIIFQLMKADLNSVNSRTFQLNTDTSDMSNNDNLLVIYEAYEEDNNINILNCIFSELKNITKELKKINR